MRTLVILTFGFTFLQLGNVNAQTTEKSDTSKIILAERMPEYIGDINSFLAEHIKYPFRARIRGIEGRVICTFIVTPDGEIEKGSVTTINPKIGYGIEEEAVRVISLLKSWKPGTQNGKPVYVKCTIPIKFALDK